MAIKVWAAQGYAFRYTYWAIQTAIGAAIPTVGMPIR